MPFREFDESDPDHPLTEALQAIRDLAENNPSEIAPYSDQLKTYLPLGLVSSFHRDLAVEAIFSLLAVAVNDPEARPWFEPVIDLVEAYPPAKKHCSMLACAKRSLIFAILSASTRRLTAPARPLSTICSRHTLS